VLRNELAGHRDKETQKETVDHAKVAQWRRAEAERLTRERRPDLWAAYQARQAAKTARNPKDDKPKSLV